MGHLREWLATWSFEPWLVGGVLLVTVGYLLLAGWVSARHPAQRWPLGQTACFLAGVAVVVAATLGPVGALDDVFFWAHMAQHLLLMMVAAPLLILGQPVLLVLRASSPGFRHRVVVPVLRSPVVRFVTHPVVAWLVFAGVLVGTHVSGFFEYALEHDPVHTYLEHPLYLAAGLVCFYPMLGVGPAASRMPTRAAVVSLALMAIPEVLLGWWIHTAGVVLYPFYLTVADRPWGPTTALADQRLGGTLMWTAGLWANAVWVGAVVWVGRRSARRRVHRAAAERVALTPLPDVS